MDVDQIYLTESSDLMYFNLIDTRAVQMFLSKSRVEQITLELFSCRRKKLPSTAPMFNYWQRDAQKSKSRYL